MGNQRLCSRADDNQVSFRLPKRGLIVNSYDILSARREFIVNSGGILSERCDFIVNSQQKPNGHPRESVFATARAAKLILAARSSAYIVNLQSKLLTRLGYHLNLQ